jgi:hypothetical protein
VVLEDSRPPPGPPKDKCRIEVKIKIEENSFKNMVVLHYFKSNCWI